MRYRAKLIIAYLGSSYAGWQRQTNARSVQGEIERAFKAMTKGLFATVDGAGRTDAGVHARGQTAHLDVPARLDPKVLARSLNAELQRDIRVLRAVKVHDGFHARHHALGKHYTYRARWREAALPWQGQRHGRVQRVKYQEALEQALALLPGHRDMASFTVCAPIKGTTVKSLSRVWCRETRGGLDLHFVGRGFLRYQVRRMVGALLHVGWGQMSVDDVAKLIENPIPGAGVFTAPAAGLTLERVFYRQTPLLTPADE